MAVICRIWNNLHRCTKTRLRPRFFMPSAGQTDELFVVVLRHAIAYGSVSVIHKDPLC